MLIHLPSIQIYIHQIKEFPLRDSRFFPAKPQNFLVKILYFLFLLCKLMTIKPSMITPSPDTIHTPVVKDSGTSIPSAKSFTVHARLPKFLTEVNHHRVRIHTGRNHQSRKCLKRITRKEIGSNALLIMVFKEVQHMFLNIIHSLPARSNSCSRGKSTRYST